MPKGYQNDVQMDANINDFSYFSEKGENARNYLFYNRKRSSEQVKIEKKRIQNRCKMEAREKDAERSQNEPKGIQNGYRNQSKIAKRDQRGTKGSPKRRRRPEKSHAKNEAEKTWKMDAKRFGTAECAWPPQSAIMALPGLTRPILTEFNTAVAPRRGAPYLIAYAHSAGPWF